MFTPCTRTPYSIDYNDYVYLHKIGNRIDLLVLAPLCPAEEADMMLLASGSASLSAMADDRGGKGEGKEGWWDGSHLRGGPKPDSRVT